MYTKAVIMNGLMINSRGNRAEQDKKLIAIIKTICKEGHNTYGVRRIKKILDQQDIVISCRLITRLMKQANLVCKIKRKFKTTTDSNHKMPVASNLLARQFMVDAPDCWILPMFQLKKAGYIWREQLIYIPEKLLVGQ